MTLVWNSVSETASFAKDHLKEFSYQFKYMLFWNCVNDDKQDDWGDYKWGWWSGWRGTLCSVILATGAANSMRLPQEVAQAGPHGAAPFLAANALVAILLGLPMLMLKFGLSRFSEQGAIKIWRAVPLLKGIGYVKLVSSFLVAVYYMIYVSVSCAVLIWTAKGPIPLIECTELHRDLDGYHLNGTTGQKCMNKTFLKSVNEEPVWYGITSAIMFTFWLLIPLCLIKIPQSFQRAIYCLGSISVFLCVVLGLLGNVGNIRELFREANWKLLLSIRFWYSAFIQMLFSMHIGFGYITTTAVTFYDKNNILWSTVFLVIWNLCSGWFYVSLWYGLGNIFENQNPSVLMIVVLIYNSSVFGDIRLITPSFGYALIMVSALTSALMLLYPIIWCMSCEGRWKKTTLGCGVAVVGGGLSLIIFIFGLDVITLLDKHIIPMYLMATIFLEVAGLLFIYGYNSIKQDIEFIMRSKISYLWYIFWTAIPFGILLFALSKIMLYVYEWPLKNWLFWLMIIMFTLAFFNITIWGAWIIWNQEGYGFIQKLVSAAKPSRKWGPVDAVIRNKWLQYKLHRKKPVNDIHQYQRPQNQRTLLRTEMHQKTNTIYHTSTLERSQKINREIQPCCSNCHQKDHCVYLCEVNYKNGTWINKD